MYVSQEIHHSTLLLKSLIGKQIWDVRRSHGNCFLAEFGSVTGETKLRYQPKRPVQKTGDFSLVVEFCRWRIEAEDAATHSDDEDHSDVQRVMDRLQGRIVTDVLLDAKLNLVLKGGATIALGPGDPPEPGATAYQWFIRLPDRRYLSRDTDGRFALERN